MATLPEVVGFDTDIVIASQPSRTWIIDRDTMQVAGMDEGLEAVRQAVEIALDVERFRWTIYSANFGSEFDELVGQDEAEIPRLVEGALSQDDRVVQVEDYVFTRTGPDSMHVAFTVRTVYGNLIEEMQI